LRSDRGLDGPNDWIYYQDTETQIGEDTVLGNLDFVLNSDDSTRAGSGIILYSQGWNRARVWWSMLNGYLVGLELHKGYAKVKGGLLGLVKGIITGLVADAISPWYALFFGTKGYDEISKDTPLTSPDEKIVESSICSETYVDECKELNID
jgi:hypothetical protein